jgi:hypothetical protein
MRYSLVGLCLATAAACASPALSVESGGGASSTIGPTEPNGPGFDYDIQLNLIHTIPCTFAQEVLDMGSWTSGGSGTDWLYLLDAESKEEWIYNITANRYAGHYSLKRSPMESPYGYVHTGYSWSEHRNTYYTDNERLYDEKHDDEWVSYAFPWSPGIGRCIDWDPVEERLWTVNNQLGVNHLFSFLWGGDIHAYQVLDANDDQYLGIGVFPFEGDLGFVFSEEDELELDFYRRSGDVLEKMGEAEVDFMPGIDRITSVDWHYTRESFFCAYEVAGDYYVSEFSVDFGSGNDVDPPSEVVETSFGQVKAMYR